ncbi:neuronal acetylcholine receptor subunit beta-4-like [Saccostrea echinata]|uniref:neuronal acetylcholine receptor subunit beta-4-like n=1 Tax=Saccostrea echinata TaxID=191078 RepID=UPI002A8218AA|nr:neuronal acetylcholine receptor subunit beta-4-like [Saccostrea echinata]
MLLTCLFYVTEGALYQEKFESFIKTSVYSYYEKRIRPITDQSKALDVKLSYSAVAINGLDAAGGTLEIVGILTATWYNDLLIFNTSTDWNGLGGLLFPQNTFWRPSLVLDNSATSLTEVGDSSYRIRIDGDGKHEWIIGLVASSACSVDVTNFPFDSHSCELIFTPWGTTSSEVTLSPMSTTVDQTHYSESTEWTFLSSSLTSSTKNNASYLTITINLKRSPGYFFVNLVMPIVVVALLNILVFLLPSECGERVGYSVTIFLTFAVYLDIITATLPKSTDSTAKLSNYLISMVVLGAVTTLMIIMSLYVYHKDEEAPIPQWLVKLSTCMHCKCGKGERKAGSVAPSRTPSPKDNIKKPIGPTNTKVGIGSRQNTLFDMELQEMDVKNEKIPIAFPENTPINNFSIESVSEDDDDEEDDVIDWHYVAASLDYLFCFITFWITLGLSCFFLLPLAFV